MKLDSDLLARMRDELVHAGQRATVPPTPGRLPVQSDAERTAVIERVSPICEVLYLLMVADAEQHRNEQELLRGAVRALTDGALRRESIDGMLMRFESALSLHGRDERLTQVTGQLAADRQDAEAAFTLAAVMAIADERAEADEQALLDELRELLGISTKRARTLLGEVRDSLRPPPPAIQST